MLLRTIVLLGIFNLLTSALGEHVTQSSQSVPSCALPCVTQFVSQSPCGSANQTCLCETVFLESDITNCVLDQCSLRDSLAAKNFTQTLCQVPVRDRSLRLSLTTIIFGTIASLMVILRIGYKLVSAAGFDKLKSLSADDWLMCIVVIVGIATNVFQIEGTIANGMGKDIWTLTPRMITQFSRFFFFAEISYFFELTMIKMSITIFYLRLFTAPIVRRLLWATLVFTGLVGAASIALGIVQCNPLASLDSKWNRTQHHESCIDNNTLAWANAGVTIGLDLWLIAVPLSQIRKLQLDWKRKVGAAMMFSVGILVTSVSIARLGSLIVFAQSFNPTWDDVSTTVWSTVEVDLSIICACMPSFRLILVRIFPCLGQKERSIHQHSDKQQDESGIPFALMAPGNRDAAPNHCDLSLPPMRRRDSDPGPAAHHTPATAWHDDDESRTNSCHDSVGTDISNRHSSGLVWV